MNKLFDKSRIKLQEMMDDVFAYTRQVYNQSSFVYTSASPWGQIISVLMKLGQMMFYYIEDSVTELFINKASRPSSIYGLARLSGHNPTRAIASMGDLALIHNGTLPDIIGQNVILPNLSKIKCKDNGYTYLLVLGQDELKINVFQDKKKNYLKVIQGNIESNQFTGTGLPMQSYECNMPEGKYIDNFFVNVFVNGEKWKKYDSLYDIPLGTKGCIVKTGITSGIDVYFGTNNKGVPPPSGSTILVEYLITEGYAGNIANTDAQFEFVDPGYDEQGNEIDLNSLFSLVMATPIAFGAPPEPTYLTRLLAPNVSRSFVLANPINYITFFEKMQLFSYIYAYTKYNIYDPYVDNIMYLLLIPDIQKRFRRGDNYFTVPVDMFKLTDLEKYKLQVLLEESGQKLLGTIINFVDPQFKRYIVNVYLTIWDGYNKDGIHEKVITKLSDYFSSFRRKDFLPKSDLISIIESIDGVDSVNIGFVSEDVEYEINQLMNPDTIFSSENINMDELFAMYEKLLAEANDNPEAIKNISIEKKLNIIFSYQSFKEFVFNHIDENGDIVIGQNEIPMIRGGWKDRFSRYYEDSVGNKKLGSVNVIFVRENPKTMSSSINNININTLK